MPWNNSLNNYIWFLENLGERMDRHDAVLTNLQGGQPNENEVESGSEEDYQSEIEVR